MRRLIASVLLTAIASSGAADIPVARWQAQQAADSLRTAILYLAAHDQNQHDEVSGLIIALGLMKAPEADRVLVALSDYYLGESVAEDTNSVVTHRGKALLPLLRAHLLKAPECEPQLKCLTREERDERLREWIGYLERGEKVEFNK